jgi:hypothetical protein
VRKERQTSIWDTVGHFFSRFFLIFIVAVGLGTTFWNYRGSPSAPAPPATQDKIALELKKLDEFVTKTTKYIQVSPLMSLIRTSGTGRRTSLCSILIFFQSLMEYVSDLILFQSFRHSSLSHSPDFEGVRGDDDGIEF